ncbi:MAG TPA: helix-turn-helix domain-containing protein [Thermopolyspora sp.]
MSPDERRKMIVASTLPLVAEHGAAVTTRQIARAAGIGEATIFRVFTDKNELIDACVAEALRPDALLAALAEIPLEQPVAARLTEAAGCMQAHLSRLGSVVGALHATGHGRDRFASGSAIGRRRARTGAPGDSGQGDGGQGDGQVEGDVRDTERELPTRTEASGRDDSIRRIREAVGDLLEPEGQALRMPAHRLAGLFLDLLFSRSRPVGDDGPSLEEVVDLFLHGALS